MSDTAHQEKHFENYIVSRLEAQGWKVGETAKYDTERALYAEDLIAWLEASGQGEKWAKLKKDNGDRALEVLMDRLAKALETHGTVQVLRQGFSIAGCGHIDLSEAAPEDKRNVDVLKRYAANILRVVPQLQYHPSRKLAIDLVLFINGIPVATVELKTDFTQSAEAAMDQYRTDRLPYDPKTKRREPLLTFKRGAVVHFAMSDSEIQMATKLDGDNTFFLPFNKGNDGHAGNPEGELKADGTREYPVAYFWEAVCQQDAWLRVFHSFVYVEKKDVVDLKGNWSKKETLMACEHAASGARAPSCARMRRPSFDGTSRRSGATVGSPGSSGSSGSSVGRRGRYAHGRTRPGPRWPKMRQGTHCTEEVFMRISDDIPAPARETPMNGGPRGWQYDGPPEERLLAESALRWVVDPVSGADVIARGLVRTVVVDELHALAPTKRGDLLALALSRLAALAPESAPAFEAAAAAFEDALRSRLPAP